MNNKLEVIKLSLLAIIALCLVTIVLQGFDRDTQDVYVRGGDIEVSGRVDVDNTVDVNLHEINNHRDVFFNNPSRGDKNKYYVIPVTVE
jgi:hypothetical protein